MKVARGFVVSGLLVYDSRGGKAEPRAIKIERVMIVYFDEPNQ
jgi:hypothetical protein